MKTTCLNRFTLGLLLLSQVGFAERQPLAFDQHTLTGQKQSLRPREDFAGACLNARRLSTENLIHLLKLNYNVHYTGPVHKADRELLVYLAAYFHSMNFVFEPALNFSISDNSGPELVKKTGNSLLFSANASKDVFTRKLGESLDKLPNANEVHINFNNTLFEQLTNQVATTHFLQKAIENNYGISTDPKVGGYDEAYARDMTKEELSMLFKQLADLPKGVVSSLKLKQVIRMEEGFTKKESREAAADYSAKNQRIRLLDGAFKEGITSSEGTLLHEMGHALWESLNSLLKDRFRTISWKNNGNDRWESLGRGAFVSEYARKNPEEDFAEHFSAYVNSPEWLKKNAPEKYAYFKENVFGTTEYFAQGSDRTRIAIDSSNPDTTPPNHPRKSEGCDPFRSKEDK